MHLARSVHRLLRGVDRQITAYRAWSEGTGTAAAGVAESVAVTSREPAVLGLLAEGLTAIAIGRRLGIAERTVPKHLQHCYAKLGVSDRLGAVLRARRIGLLGTQFPP
ncbi:LuxR C-terminal-related transcriptional regulator [Pseudonocardia saturnea]